MLESTLAVKVTVSEVAFPKSTLPLNVDIPDTVTFGTVSRLVEGL